MHGLVLEIRYDTTHTTIEAADPRMRPYTTLLATTPYGTLSAPPANAPCAADPGRPGGTICAPGPPGIKDKDHRLAALDGRMTISVVAWR